MTFRSQVARCFKILVYLIPGGGLIFEHGVAHARSRRLKREAAQHAETLRITVARLRLSNADLERFAYVISHDLQEPLRMITCYTELLDEKYRGTLDDQADKYIGYIVDSSKRMQTLLNDLLKYSRIHSSKKKREVIDCNTVVEHVVADLQLAIQEASAVVHHGPLPKVVGDATQLRQVFQNLIANGIKFHGKQTPEIWIEAQQSEGNRLTLSIRDNGIGIKQEHHGRIFEVFQRLHVQQDYPGNGIGLAIAQRIIETHGGQMWLDSQEGQGATFYFTLQAP